MGLNNLGSALALNTFDWFTFTNFYARFRTQVNNKMDRLYASLNNRFLIACVLDKSVLKSLHSSRPRGGRTHHFLIVSVLDISVPKSLHSSRLERKH